MGLPNTHVIKSLYQDIEGFQASKSAINKMPYYYVGFEYGGPTIDSFYENLSEINIKNKKTFYDLGSGIGDKTLISAYCLGFEKSIGIELLPELYSLSKEVGEKAKGIIDSDNVVTFVNADFNKYPINDADVVYISLEPFALQIALSVNLKKKFEILKKGTILITTQTAFDSKSYNIIRAPKYKYQNGEGVMYIHQKTA